MSSPNPHTITTEAQLADAYPIRPSGPSLTKESAVITPRYGELIAAAPFCVLTTIGEGGLDCSPRGDAPGFVRIRDPRTLEIPDRRGNNRLDTLRNLLRDDRIGLIFVIPGVNECIRVRGTAIISTDPEVGVSSRPKVCNTVLLPEPEAPIRATISPGFTCRLTSFKIWIDCEPSS